MTNDEVYQPFLFCLNINPVATTIKPTRNVENFSISWGNKNLVISKSANATATIISTQKKRLLPGFALFDILIFKCLIVQIVDLLRVPWFVGKQKR